MRTSSLYFRTSSVIAVASAIGAAAYAAPEAGYVIGNQAVASYTNTAGDTITVTSNKVETVVQQVSGVSMTSDNTENIAPGGKAYLPHIVTNEGNGPDFFSLSAVEGAGALDMSNYVFYPDADMDGVADSATPITQTPVLAPGEQFGFVVDVTVPSNSASGASDSLTVTALSNQPAPQSASNVDTLTVSSQAIMELVKSMTVDPASGGDPNIVDGGDTVEITLTYSSTGLTAADSYVVQDVLDGALIYSPGTAKWSDAPGFLDENNLASPDATNGQNETIAWQASGQNLQFEISQVAPGRRGSVTFEATIEDPAQAGIITNTATQSDANNSFPPSNTASVTVDADYQVAIADTKINSANAPDASVLSSTDDDNTDAGGNPDPAGYNDVVWETGDVYQGATIPFEFVLTNLSNQADSLELSVDNLDFPAGTTFRFVAEDGVSPIVGSVGPIAPGDTRKVTLLATLPTDVVPVPSSEFTANVTTTSVGSGLSDSSTAEFRGAVLASAVDLENDLATAAGDGANPTNPTGDPWITNATDPGQATVFDMNVQNLGATSDSYNLSLASPLDPGWTVEFQLADGTVVTNTGTIPKNQTLPIKVVITPPDGEMPGNYPVTVQVLSSVSGQGDSIVNQVAVNKIVDVSIVEDQVTQASPGGVVDMVHTVTNNGNIAITEGAITESGLSNFSGAIYWDKNGDGQLNPTEPIVDNFNDFVDNVAPGTPGLAPGDTLSLIYRVQTPSTSTAGLSEIGTVTLASTLNGADAETDADTANNAVEDRVVIVSGDVTLTKYQYVDANCDGTPGTFSKNRFNVEPGQCVRYRVDAENTGTSNANDVTIRDVAPAYTQIVNCGGSCAATADPAGSTITSSVSAIESYHATVLPGGMARLEFTVKVEE